MTAVKQLYEGILLRNLSSVASIESAIRNITWLLPGRFEDSEIASEGCESRPYSLGMAHADRMK
jgi:peroxin-16